MTILAMKSTCPGCLAQSIGLFTRFRVSWTRPIRCPQCGAQLALVGSVWRQALFVLIVGFGPPLLIAPLLHFHLLGLYVGAGLQLMALLALVVTWPLRLTSDDRIRWNRKLAWILVPVIFVLALFGMPHPA